MLSDTLTILVIPSKKGKVIRFALSSFFLKGLLITLIASAILSAATVFDYFRVKELDRIQSRLKNEIILQKFVLQGISNRLSEKHERLKELEKFDRKLRLISGLQESTTRIRYIGKSINNSDNDFTPRTGDIKVITKLQKIDLDTKLREISFFQLGAYLQERKDRLARTPSIAPTKGAISSRFGPRSDPFTGKIRTHWGLDFSNRQYTPIYAPADGVVVNTFKNGNFGEFLVIDHGYNIVSRYGHLSKYEVTVGQKVKRGDLIARIGNTGRSTAPHLHYEILVRDQYQDPEKYILE